MKIPKQFNHWARLVGLRREHKRSKYSWVGRGRRWRINNRNQFQMSCPIDNFDRWANSVEVTIEIPISEYSLINTVNNLLANSN